MTGNHTPQVGNFKIGLNPFTGGSTGRDPWDVDDVSTYLKPVLCQVEIERKEAVTYRYDRDGEIARDSLVDPWKPLRDLTRHLLPHLAFAGIIDSTTPAQVKCLWQVHATETIVDFDDLSSGEKSIIQMFYPLIENKIKTLVAEIREDGEPQDLAEVCVLIDEPELHLHPNLQIKVLDYLRVLTSQDNLQVILATHSPTIVEAASFEELFLLRPIELVGLEENQLVQVASDDERLLFLRDVFGSTSNLTAMQPVVIVEGVEEQEAKKTVSDRKLYRALHPGFDGVTLIAGGGKGECKALLGVLDDALKSFSSELSAVALLDRDTTLEATGDNVHLLPVSMIENFLLDPDAIWEAIQSVYERTALDTVDAVAQALDDLLTEMEAEERDRRAKAILGLAYFRPALPIEKIPTQAAKFAFTFQGSFSRATVRVASQEAAAKVSELREQQRRREEFHGKEVLTGFYRRHLHHTGMPKNIFTFEAARYASRRKAVSKYFDAFFTMLSNPSDIGR
jgi:hypothetical protein